MKKVQSGKKRAPSPVSPPEPKRVTIVAQTLGEGMTVDITAGPTSISISTPVSELPRFLGAVEQALAVARLSL
jgi:hypothetical protein